MADAVHDALAEVDRALEARPKHDGHALSAAVRCLAALRDGIILRQGQDGGTRFRDVLERVNAVLSVVMAAQFPIGEIPWAELEAARGWLAALSDANAGQ